MYKFGKNPSIDPKSTIYDNVELGDNVTVFPGAVIGRPPLTTSAVYRQSMPRNLPTKIGNRCVIGANAVIYEDVEVGDDSMVCDTACIREGARVGKSTLVAQGVTINYNTRVGDRVKILDNAHLTGNMVVEDDAVISMLVSTANDNSMGREYARTGRDLSAEQFGPTIKRFATIGHGALLSPGIIIGENAIVGANAVVTKDVEDRTVVMGIPARFVRYLREEEIRS